MNGGRRFGPFVIDRELGRGAMGVVYAAHRADSGEPVALKVILDGAADPASAERFEREARAVGQLAHPNVVALREVGIVEGRPFLALELVAGETLDARLRRGELDRASAVRIVREVALALAHAHERGVVHRDLKPSNVMVDESGRARLVDFGLSRGQKDARLTTTGALVGTPRWLAPEQARADGTAVGSAADVHALGALLYRVLVGRPPFEGDEIGVVKKILLDRPAAPRTLDATVPAALDALVVRCLEKDPARRPQAAEVARTLELLGGEARPRRSRLAVVAIGALPILVAGAALAGLGFARRATAPPPPRPASPPSSPSPRPPPPPSPAPSPTRRRRVLPPLDLETVRREQTEAFGPGFTAESALESMRANLATATRNDPRGFRTSVLRAQVRLRERSFDSAIQNLTNALELAAEPIQGDRDQYRVIRTERGRLLFLLGRHDEALADAEWVLETTSLARGARELRGLIRGLRGGLDAGIEDLSEVLRQDPTWWSAWMHRGELRLQKGDVGGEEDVQRAIDSGVENPTLWMSLSRIDERANDLEGAIESARRAATLDPTDPFAHDRLGALEAKRR